MNAITKNTPDTGIRQIPLTAIKLDPLAQPRAELDHDLVAEYAEAMAAGEQFPPLIVFNDRRTYWLADGFHRHAGALTAGLREVTCVINSGGLREAILYSCSANAAHGWRRSNSDKRRAVETLLADDEWSRWSDREIARHAKVHHTFVGKLRSVLTGADTSEDSDDRPRQYRSKHGTTASMETGRIGKAGASKSEAVARAPHTEPSPSPEHPHAAALRSIRMLAAGLCALHASPKEIASAIPHGDSPAELAGLCQQAAALLTQIAASIAESSQ